MGSDGTGGVRVDVNQELKLLYKCKKKCIKLEFMLMKHYAPNRCEPSIEVGKWGGGGVRLDVNREVKFLL